MLTESESAKPTIPRNARGARQLSGQNMHIGVMGTNFKTAPISVREYLAKQITIDKLLNLGYAGRGVSEVVLLSTCNRIELYYASEDLDKASRFLAPLFLIPRKSPVEDFKTYNYADGLAAEHLFEVSSGLDSLVIGEAQILFQVREASELANERGLCGPLLSKLFSKAYDTGREVRETHPKFTNGFRNSVSLSVSELISSHFGKKRKKPNILLIGSGKMIKLAVNSFDRENLGRIVVAARRSPLKELGADEAVRLSELSQTLVRQDIDVIITATSSEDFVLKPADVEPVSKCGKELLIFDISVPRNVDPEISKHFENVVLLNLDDLKGKIMQDEVGSYADRTSDLTAIRESIIIHSREFITWIKENSQIAPLMMAVRRRAEQVRSEEVANALARLETLTPDQRDVIVKMSERIIRRFLHEPTLNLKNLIRTEGAATSGEYVYLLRQLFSRDQKSAQDDEMIAPNQSS